MSKNSSREALALCLLALESTNQPPWVAEELVASCLKVARSELFLHENTRLTEEMWDCLWSLVERAKKEEPLDYLLGEKSFFGARIRTDRRALIPRPETEILADHVAKRLRGKTLVDLCCGSGCLGISLKKKFPHLRVFLSDLSKEALSLAKENAELNKVEVECIQGDLLCPSGVDAIVCNPPYVARSMLACLDPSVRDFEPHMALDGGEEGVVFYERLARLGSEVLNQKGQLFLEIGATQGARIKEIFSGSGWGKQELVKDWAGLDRFFFLEKQLLFPVS